MTDLFPNFPEIPEFLRVDQAEQERRREWWKGRKLTKQGVGFRTIDAAEERERSKLQREYDRQQAAKRRDRLNAFLESRR